MQLPQPQQEELSLKDAAELLLDECRMVLPGIQALFGFQLVVVFSARFERVLSTADQHLHLAAIALIALAIGLIMTPAALHRQAGPYRISRAVIDISTRLLLCSMLPLSLGIALDFYLVAKVLLGGPLVPWLAASLLVLLCALWFALPRWIKTSRVEDDPPDH